MASTSPPTLERRINEIQDIEDLRTLALIHLGGDDDLVTIVNKIFTDAIDVLVTLLFGFAVVTTLNSLAFLKYYRNSKGFPVKWLEWL